MRLRNISLWWYFIAAAFATVSCAVGGKSPVPPDTSAVGIRPTAVLYAPDGLSVFVAEEGTNRVTRRECETGDILTAYDIGCPPRALAVSQHGTRLYVAAGDANGVVVIIDLTAGKELSRIPVGHTPVSATIDPGGRWLFVCNRFGNSVSVIETVSQREVSRIPDSGGVAVSGYSTGPAYVPGGGLSPDLAAGAFTASAIPRDGEPGVEPVTIVIPFREPVCAAFGGGTLFVANHLPFAGDVAAAIVTVDTASMTTKSAIKLPNGSTGIRGMCASPDGTYIYVTHILARYNLPTTQLDRGWMNTNALSIIDALTKRLVNTVLLDDVDRGAANPWGVACPPDGAFIAVAHAGTHEVSLIDRAALHTRLNNARREGKAAAVPNDLAFLTGIRTRVPIEAEGARSIAWGDDEICVTGYYTDAIAFVRNDMKADTTPTIFSLGEPPAYDESRHGERLFNDATFCFQGWQSCASCHPDARSDGLTWDLLNDGFGNPKNTKSLVLSHATPPVMATGIRPQAETAVRAGMSFIMFADRSEEAATAIDIYLRGIDPIPGPSAKGSLSPAEKRGKQLFEEASCARCHPSPLFTDLKTYDVGTGTGRDTGQAFDTPTLRELWRTGPYLYDGRAATLEDVLTTYNKVDSHGVSSTLTEKEIDDLVEYLLTL